MRGSPASCAGRSSLAVGWRSRHLLLARGQPCRRGAEPAADSAGQRPCLSPLSVAVAEDGGVWFSENYAGLLHRGLPAGRVTTPVSAPGNLELSAVGEHDGTVWYAVTGRAHTVGKLRRLEPDRTDTVVADLYAHERRTNPDHVFHYGFRDLPASCAAALPRGGRTSYRGRVETHPVASLPAYGAVYVADAAANSVLAVVARRGDDGRGASAGAHHR